MLYLGAKRSLLGKSLSDLARIQALSGLAAFYDFSDKSTLFQDSAGTQPVTAFGQPVGRVTDKSKGRGVELALSSWFNNGDTWTASAPTLLRFNQVAGGLVEAEVIAVYTGVARVYKTITVTANTNYEVIAFASALQATDTPFGVEAITTANATLAVATRITDGEVRFVFNSGANTVVKVGLAVLGTSEVVGDKFFLSSISVREIPGVHLIQPTAINRPVLSARVNLLTKTEDFSDAAWTTAAAAVTVLANDITAPDGTLAADKLVPAVGTGWRVKRQLAAINTGPMVQSVYAKEGALGVHLELWTASGYGAIFNLTTGAVITAIGCTTAVGPLDAYGFRRYEMRYSGLTLAPTNDIRLTTATNLDSQMVGDGVKGFWVWGAQLESGSTPTRYQRVNTATDYDTVGFPSYLSFNGTNQWMQTASNLDLSGTDKVTVVAGVRKLSDASASILFELGSATNQRFYVSAPPGAGAASYGFNVKGTTDAEYAASSFSAPTTNVVSAAFDLAAATLAGAVNPRVNGVIPTLTPTLAGPPGGGVFTNRLLYIGTRSGTSLFFNGNLHTLCIRSALSTQPEIDLLERFTNSKTGAY